MDIGRAIGKAFKGMAPVTQQWAYAKQQEQITNDRLAKLQEYETQRTKEEREYQGEIRKEDRTERRLERMEDFGERVMDRATQADDRAYRRRTDQQTIGLQQERLDLEKLRTEKEVENFDIRAKIAGMELKDQELLSGLRGRMFDKSLPDDERNKAAREYRSATGQKRNIIRVDGGQTQDEMGQIIKNPDILYDLDEGEVIQTLSTPDTNTDNDPAGIRALLGEEPTEVPNDDSSSKIIEDLRRRIQELESGAEPPQRNSRGITNNEINNQAQNGDEPSRVFRSKGTEALGKLRQGLTNRFLDMDERDAATAKTRIEKMIADGTFPDSPKEATEYLAYQVGLVARIGDISNERRKQLQAWLKK
jgi:hypothetical protein